MDKLQDTYSKTGVLSKPWLEAIETIALAVVVSCIVRVFIFQAFYIPTRSMANTLEPLDHILSEKVSYNLFPPRRGDIVIFNFGNDVLGSDFTLQQAARVNPHAVYGATSDELREKRDYVKRVIGVGGDEVSFETGVLKLNGHPILEPYLSAACRANPLKGNCGFAFRIKGRKLSFADGGVTVDGKNLDRILTANFPLASIEDRRPSNFVRVDGNTIGVLKVRVPEGYLFLMGDNRPESADSRYFGFVSLSCVKGRALLTYWPPARFRLL